MDFGEMDVNNRHIDYAAGALTFLVSVFGVVINLLGAYFLNNIRVLRGSFSFLCISHSLAQAGLLIIFAGWSAPRMIMQNQDRYSFLNRKIGQLLLVFWFSILYSQVLISLNRFCLIASPMTFEKMFTDRRTITLIVCIWVVSVLHGIIYFFPDCNFSFNSDHYSWEYEGTARGRFLEEVDFVHAMTICGSVLLLDLITLIMLHARDTRSNITASANSEEMTRKKRRDLMFFVQACTNSVIFALASLCYHFLSQLATTKWEMFLCSTLAWCSAHTLDGCVLLTFNYELRHVIFRPHKWFRLKDNSQTFDRHGSTTKINNWAGCSIVGVQYQQNKIALFGVVVNLLVAYLLYNIRSLRGSFSFLCISHTLAQAGILSIFGFWSAPLIVVKTQQQWSLLNRKMGHLLLIFWFSILYSQVLISLNRFSIIVFPMMFKKVFTNKRTVMLIICIWIISLMHGVVYFFPGCDFAFNAEVYYWQYEDTDCGRFLARYLDFAHALFVCVSVLLLDLITLMMLHHRDSKSSVNTLSANNEEMRRRKRRDLMFFVQACTNSVIFALLSLCFHFFSKLTTTKWEAFLCSTLVWCLAHTLDGCVLLTFNYELRRVIFRPHKWFSFSSSSQACGGRAAVGSASNPSTGKTYMLTRSTIAVVH